MARPNVSSIRDEPPDDGLPPAELYRNAFEEYRFQIRFNWQRTQYLLAFNAAILAAAVGLTGRAGRLGALLFAFGAVVAALSSVVHSTQHGYYQAARNRVKRVERMLDVPAEARVDTTGNLGGRRVRVKVTAVVNLLLWAMCLVQVTGVVLVLAG